MPSNDDPMTTDATLGHVASTGGLGAVPKRAGLTPHQKIARAYKRKTGVSLTAEDVRALGFDDAIMTRARNDDLGESEDA